MLETILNVVRKHPSQLVVDVDVPMQLRLAWVCLLVVVILGSRVRAFLQCKLDELRVSTVHDVATREPRTMLRVSHRDHTYRVAVHDEFIAVILGLQARRHQLTVAGKHVPLRKLAMPGTRLANNELLALALRRNSCGKAHLQRGTACTPAQSACAHGMRGQPHNEHTSAPKSSCASTTAPPSLMSITAMRREQLANAICSGVTPSWLAGDTSA